MVCDDTWCAGYGRHEYDPDECPLHTWPPRDSVRGRVRTFMRRLRLAALIWWGGLPHSQPLAWLRSWRIAGQQLRAKDSKPLRPLADETTETKGRP